MSNPVTITEYTLVDHYKQISLVSVKEPTDVINIGGVSNNGQYCSFSGTDGLEFKQWAESLGMEPICMQRTFTELDNNRKVETGTRIF